MKTSIIALILTFVCSVNMFSQGRQTTAESDALFAKGVDLYKQGKYLEAIPLFAKSDSIDKAVLDSTSNRRDYSAMWLSSCYYKLNNIDKAKKIDSLYYAISPIDRRLTVSSDSLLTLGETYWENGDSTKALEVFKKCANLESLSIGEKHPCYANSLKVIATVYDMMGYPDKAARYERQAMDIYEEALGRKHSLYETSLINSIAYTRKTNDFATIDSLHNVCLDYIEELVGKNHEDYLYFLSLFVDYYLSVEKYIDAIRLQNEALTINEVLYGNHSEQYCLSLTNLADFHDKNGDYPKAIQLAETSLSLCEEASNKYGYTFNLNSLALYCFHNGDNKRAIELSEKGLQLTAELYGTDNLNYATALSNYGMYVAEIGDYNKALDLENQSFKLLLKHTSENSDVILYSLTHLSHYYYLAGNYNEAIQYVNKALLLCKELYGSHHYMYANSLRSKADYCDAAGDYSNALTAISEAISIYEHLQRNTDLCLALEKAARIYYSLNNPHNAVFCAEKSLEIYKTLYAEKDVDYYNRLSFLAIYYFADGENEKALEYCQEITSFYNDNLSLDNVGSLLMISNYLIAQNVSLGNDLEEISKWILSFMELYELKGNKNTGLYADFLSNIADIHYEAYNNKEAVVTMEKAVNLIRAINGDNHPNYWIKLSKLTMYRFDNQDYTTLSKDAKNITQWTTNFILTSFSNLTSIERSMFWDNYNIWFNRLLPEYAATLRDESLIDLTYDATLLSKGLLLNTEIEMQKLILESGDDQLLNKYNELTANKKTLFKLYQTPKSNRILNTDSLERVNRLLENDLLQQSKAYGDYTKNLQIKWQDVKEKLKDTDMAIEFIEYSTKNGIEYAALALKSTWERPRLIPLFKEEDLASINTSNYYTTSAISELIFNPLKEELQGVQNIYFSPAGELHNIAIEHIPNEYISIDKVNMYRLTSTRQLVLEKEKKIGGKAILYGGLKYNTSKDALEADSRKYTIRGASIPFNLCNDREGRSLGDAPELPGTLEEVKDIRALLNKYHFKAEIYTDSIGTEISFKNLSEKKSRLLHIATHGFYWESQEIINSRKKIQFLTLDTDSPKYIEDLPLTRSGLLFAGANNALRGEKMPDNVDDGILTAREIYQLDLRGLELVVLSACQTGLGEITGDGVFGLQRGFKKAGAQSLLMSLWKVDDAATQLLMTQFYANLMVGKSKLESLRDAQRFVKEYEIEKEVTVKSGDAKKVYGAKQKKQSQKDEKVKKEVNKVTIKEKPFQDPKYWAAFILLDAIE